MKLRWVVATSTFAIWWFVVFTSSGRSIMTSIWYEILPVTLEADHIVILCPCEDGKAQNWLVPHQTGMHPNDAVLERVKHFFGHLFEPDASIVHSTSWRYCHRTERVILTYLVVLPQRTWKHCRDASDHLVARRLEKVKQVQGDNLHAPEEIEVDNVLAHALDHLALLNCSDDSISTVLEAGWMKVLQVRHLKPARYVARSL